MFDGYEDTEDTEVYEDELYHEESSSEQSVDSEVEFHLYSQIHYSQDLGEISRLEINEEADVAEVRGQSSVLPEKLHQDKNIVELPDDDDVQISDGHEIIVLSDTPDEDSVYRSKVKKSTNSVNLEKKCVLPGISTPNHSKVVQSDALEAVESVTRVSSQRKRASGKLSSIASTGTLQEVMVIDDSSNTEEESLISESDHVESWMLLEGSTDDKDEDILLNLEGCGTSVGEGEADVDWSISNKDVEAQICNYATMRRTNVRYYTADKNVTCRNCSKPGHLSKNCPVPRKIPPCCLCAERGHLQNACPARFCLNCSLPGHYSKECLERAYWNKHCNRCDMKGHYADACPEIWRQYHLTTKPGPIKMASSHSEPSALVYCYNCSREGHFGYECSERRMHGSVFPASPFIYYYDDEYDIKRRANRLKRKVEELQEAGLLPIHLESPWKKEKHVEHSHKKKKKPWKEHGKHHKDDKCLKKTKKSRTDKPKAKKHRNEAERGHGMEEDFPRGHKKHASKSGKKCHKSVLQAHGSKKEYVQEILEAAKRKKKRKKHKDSSPSIDEDLFLIKQRKKKSKQKSIC
ncbi:zinc finger CCHC domain-containing protein 7 [Nothoprocta perdicaria]|nr:zinc finger CCHC domain-containing protein 7 [Nothoprocta perdicaria]XP_025893871.1 zinc finger CCHC domain-containing protein 7 [Nothoprocta perdicaria]XP_025893872.1 zinc finger CCHC domain-containing protein 7 [Nothoprocta perdicaria]